eukprot:TRINITY_DN401_c0_g1_i3.p1 TRINITY_DN401_c0_g1~~TRINITY_DN401_c0_g1_i3.p1  ORF type:complete len:559 (+),score=114.40 TRINITY_DN401_c0_g1_i3:100-1776(+)
MKKGWVSLLPLLFLSLTFAHKESPLARFGKAHITEDFRDNVVLTANPDVFESNGWVNVTFSVSDPSNDDIIAVYSPANVNTTLTSPVKYKYANESKGYLKTGKGKADFFLINRRADYSFVLLRGWIGLWDGHNYTALGRSNAVKFTNYEAPTSGRLALTGNQNEMILTWSSLSSDNPVVQLGTQSGVYDTTISANTNTYTSDDVCGGIASGFGWRDPGLIHTALMSNLTPSTTYYYIFGDRNSGGFSQEYSFNCPPVLGTDQKIRVAAYGDMGKAEKDHSNEHWEERPSLETTKNVLDRINHTDLVIHIGDISYAVGYEAQWDVFLDQIEPIATKVPYMTCIGNHERDFPDTDSLFNGTDSGGECGVPYEAFFPLPVQSRDKPWYSFDFGNAHFIFMSTEHNFLIGSEQNQWIENDLKNVDRDNTPWIIFSGHRPMYIDSINGVAPDSDLAVAIQLRDNIEIYLQKYLVDVAFWGHHHSYQRTCQVYNLTCVEQGTVHVVIGMAGMGLSKNIQKDLPPYFETVILEYGFTEMDITRHSFDFKFYNNEQKLRDSFQLKK